MNSKEKSLDRLWSKLVRRRDGMCVVPLCPNRFRLEAAHIRPRRHRSTRWDLDNGLTLCHMHHKRFTQEPIQWTLFVEFLKGKDFFAKLAQKSAEILKYQDFDEIKARLERQAK